MDDATRRLIARDARRQAVRFLRERDEQEREEAEHKLRSQTDSQLRWLWRLRVHGTLPPLAWKIKQGTAHNGDLMGFREVKAEVELIESILQERQTAAYEAAVAKSPDGKTTVPKHWKEHPGLYGNFER